MTRNIHPAFTTGKAVSSSGNCHCRLGYAPADNANRDCMFCDHELRSICHIDFGSSWSARRIEASAAHSARTSGRGGRLMDATKLRTSRLCDCPTLPIWAHAGYPCVCQQLVSPSGGCCGSCLMGVHVYPQPEWMRRANDHTLPPKVDQR